MFRFPGRGTSKLKKTIWHLPIVGWPWRLGALGAAAAAQHHRQQRGCEERLHHGCLTPAPARHGGSLSGVRLGEAWR